MKQLGLRSARDLRLFLLRRSVGRSARLALDIGVNFLAAAACSATLQGLLLQDERVMPGALRAALCGLSAFGTGWFLTTVRASRLATTPLSVSRRSSSTIGGR